MRLNSNSELGHKRILIVDDQSYNIDAALIILNCAMGPEAERVSAKAFNGKQALDMVIKSVEHHNKDKCGFDLILMDCNMPFMDGYDATIEIRKYLDSLGLQ